MTRVLLIEDNEGDAELVRKRLRDPPGMPFVIDWCGSLGEGLVTCHATLPEVVLLDLNLPDSDGLETVTAFRAQASRVPLVILTGTDDLDVGLDAIRRGADDYLPKSNIASDVLRRTLSYAVERRRMLATLEREREESARLYKEAEQARQSRDTLLQIVSHDLRNHVNTMQVGLQLLKNGTVPNPARCIESIERASGTLLRLLEDLVDVAAIERGVLHVAPKAEDAMRLVDDAYDAFMPVMQKKDIRFERRKGEDRARAWADRERVVQVLGNLLGNACKFTPRGGTVTLACVPSEHEVSFSVTDSGPGIPPENRERVFERFFRGAHSGSGAGLGLAIAKALVEAHGGRIGVDSDSGHGATFWFSLPRAAERDGEASASAEPGDAEQR